MTTLADAKHETLRTQLVAEGHINDLELLWVQALGATSGSIVDGWWEVFDAAAIAPGQFNDRAIAYITQVLGAPPTDDYNGAWQFYWENATLAPPALMPPLLTDLFHWFDFGDVATLWQDTAGTVPIVDGQDILRVDNKGTSGVPVTDQFPPGPIWKADIITGPTGIHYGGVNTLGAGFPPSLQLNPWVTGPILPGTGAHVAVFARVLETAPPATGADNVFHQAGGGGTVGVEADMISLPQQQWAGNIGGNPQPVGTGVLLAEDEWVWLYADADPVGGLGRYRAAGGTEQSSAGVIALPLDGVVTLGQLHGQITEVLVYGRTLTPAERQLVIDYWDAKYGVAPFFTPPPTVVDLLHHFDFTDPLTVFKNPPATQIAVEGDFIRVIENKGTDGTPLTNSSDSFAPLLREGVLNGLQVASFEASSKTLEEIIANGHAASTLGYTLAVVFRQTQTFGGANPVTSWRDISGLLFRTSAANFAEQFHNGLGSLFSLNALTIDGWYLWYGIMVPTGQTNRTKLSGEAEQTLVSGNTPNDIVNNATFDIANGANRMQVAEVAFWDGPLTPAELASLVEYADTKYGTLPQLPPPPPPAPGNLVHHLEPGDASTVWADTAGTIPAINGGIVSRIDNKGTNGTPLNSVTGTPTYRVGNLNGTNTIEFSGANLTALAVAAGLTISTTGFTIAMVTRRRASHFGDSILWRWTPFIGNPGPSIRGKFSLNGNFGRTDLLPDEVLVADPSVIDQWYLMYWSVDPAGAVDDAKFGSPGPEIITPFGVPVDIAPGSDVRYGTSSTLVEHAEAWFWDRPLTLAERAALVALADAKYGTLPHL